MCSSFIRFVQLPYCLQRHVCLFLPSHEVFLGMPAVNRAFRAMLTDHVVSRQLLCREADWLRAHAGLAVDVNAWQHPRGSATAAARYRAYVEHIAHGFLRQLSCCTFAPGCARHASSATTFSLPQLHLTAYGLYTSVLRSVADASAKPASSKTNTYDSTFIDAWFGQWGRRLARCAGIDEDDVGIVLSMTNVSHAVAVLALMRADNVVDAILDLTPSPYRDK